ncbi:helix-turn-helix domain-containing protein [Erythrobacter mangrovi]|uniref:Helix-turn-helix domain-containing protein n=1 Tax=Erythrobacter mangrovi TaxID=2739433 RepID=A0A7D3XI45_9SPHN|nr:helix-turn-helix domain-containing protein [Erythrobacter mangrovi]QKG71019.1 helix-turn-helix domain-containing protein [Erythrobacter mangrovi]
MRSPPPDCVRLRFFLPPEDLRPFVTTIYQMVIEANEGAPVDDRLHPEWANLRFLVEGTVEAAVGGGSLQPVPRAVMVGPTSRATRFRSSGGESWGIGLLPLGWARLTEAPAADYADRFCDAFDDPAMARLQVFQKVLADPPCEPDRFRGRLVTAMRQALGPPQLREEEIVRLGIALIDPTIHSVAQLAEHTGTSMRSLERLCNLAFGFPPQLLLRRQRFLRSLAQYMLDPTLRWIDTLDSHYHDQAHFVRDFKRFMGMSPSAYAKLPHPVLGAAAHARKAIAGEAVQVLHKPPVP